MRRGHRDGDVLSIPVEGIFGFMLSAWPVAVSSQTGEFHTLTSHEHFLANEENARYVEPFHKAHELLRGHYAARTTGRSAM